MAGSSTAELRLRPTREDDLDYVVAAEADPDTAPFIRSTPRDEHRGWLGDRLHRHIVAEAGGRQRARSLNRSAGCVEEGLLRDALFDGERFESLIVMSMLRSEWNG